MQTYTFTENAHDDFYDAIIGSGFYNDDIDIVDSNASEQCAIAQLTVDNGLITGYKHNSNITVKQAKQLHDLFVDIIE